MMLAATISVIDDQPDADCRRGNPRTPIAQQTTLRDRAGAPHEVIVDDLSATGCRFSSPQRLAVGTLIRIGLSGAGSAQARIVRHDGDAHGCVFLQPLDAGQVAAAFRAAVVVQGPFVWTPVDAAWAAEPEAERWPGAVRLAVLASGATAAWALVVALGRVLTD